MHAQNGGLRGVNDGGSKEGPEHAAVGDGEGTAVHVLHGELVLLGLFTQSHDTFFNIGVIHVVNIAEHRHNKALKFKYREC